MSDFENLMTAIEKGDLEIVTSLLGDNALLVHQRDDSGATPLHYATLYARQDIVQLLIERGAEINCIDSQFGATPTGWAIEYLRDMGGYLAIELNDLSFAIQNHDTLWIERFLKRFPGLRTAQDVNGKPFKQLAKESGNAEIANLFGLTL